MYACLRPGGVALIGVRDYKPDEKRSLGQVFASGTRLHKGNRYVVFQTRDWDADMYEVGMYFVREESDDAAAKVICGRSRYFGISIEHLLELRKEVGFQDVHRLPRCSQRTVVR
jgi:hypothetical protein